MPRLPGPVPSAMIVKIPYSDVGVKTTAVAIGGGEGAFMTFTFNANSIFDPQASVGGSQPMWHDQYQGLYRKYFVRKFALQARIHMTSASLAHGGYVFVETHSAARGPVLTPNTMLIEHMLEAVKTPTVNAKVQRFNSVGAGQSIWKTIKTGCVPAFELKGEDAQETNTAVFGANPSNLVHTSVHWCFPQDATFSSFWVEYRCVYEVILMQPINVSRS